MHLPNPIILMPLKKLSSIDIYSILTRNFTIFKNLIFSTCETTENQLNCRLIILAKYTSDMFVEREIIGFGNSIRLDRAFHKNVCERDQRNIF